MTLPPFNVRKSLALAWLVTGLTSLPLLQFLPFDLDRQTSLLLALPALVALWPEVVVLVSTFIRRRAVNALVAGSLVTVIAAATLLSSHPAPAAVTVASWGFYAALALIAAVLTRSSDSDTAAYATLAGLAGGGLIGSALLAANWFGHNDPANASWMELVAPYAHYRHIGLHLLSAALAALALASDPQLRSMLRVLAAGAGIVIWTALLWSGSRAPLVGLAGGVLVFCWLGSVRRAFTAATLCAALLVTALGLSLLFPSRELVLGWRHASTRTFAVADVQEASSNRLAVWQASAAHIGEAPWLGFGPDGYRFLTPKTDGQQPHNLELQLLIDTGILGTMASLALFALILPRHLLWQHPIRSDIAGPIAGGAAIVAGTLATAQFDGCFYHAVSCVPAFVSLGLLCGYGTNVGMPISTSQSRLSRWLAPVLLTGACAVQLLHSLVFSLLYSPAPDPSSNGWELKLVRTFPSTLVGLPLWLDEWQQKSPDRALEWSFWAQKHAPNAFAYHLRAGLELARRGNLPLAIVQIEAAQRTAPAAIQPRIAELAATLLRPAPPAARPE